MSEQEVFELTDDGEPPSRYDQTVESFVVSEETKAVRALTADVDQLIVRSGAISGYEQADNDIVITKGPARLRRRSTVWFDHDEDGNRIPKTSFVYFYSEILPTGERYTRSWTDDSLTIHHSHTDNIIEPARDIHDRLLGHFKEDSLTPKARFGAQVIRRLTRRHRMSF